MHARPMLPIHIAPTARHGKGAVAAWAAPLATPSTPMPAPPSTPTPAVDSTRFLSAARKPTLRERSRVVFRGIGRDLATSSRALTPAGLPDRGTTALLRIWFVVAAAMAGYMVASAAKLAADVATPDLSAEVHQVVSAR